jgi:hypothetical protein
MKRMSINIVAAAGAALAIMFTTGGLAHADEAGYQQYLTDHGYGGGFTVFPGVPVVGAPGMNVNWGKTFADGYILCDSLHAGATFSDLERQYGRLPYFHPVVEAAQHALCPDTLGR